MNTPIAAHFLKNDLQKSAHPVVFMFLILPFGIISGYLTVTLAYLFTRAGVSMEQVAGLAAAALIPAIFKFIWAPLVDITLSVKKWYVISTVISALTVLATAVIPVKLSSLPLLTGVIILSNFAVSFETAAVNALAAYDTPEHLKGRVSGYIQAGNMGGSGVGGGAGLWLAQRLPNVWMAGAVLAIVCILCCFALFYVKEPQYAARLQNFGGNFKNVLKDIWLTLKTKLGLLACILLTLPIGTCAANGLFAAAAKDWKASADVVALVTGVLGGVITGFGSLIGGWICDQINRQSSYLIFGLVQAACAVAMAYLPHTEWMYIFWTLAYAATAGAAYAAYNAFTLEAIGKGAAATKFELLAGVSNIPIYLVTFYEGIAYTKWGAKGMLYMEAVCAVAAIALFAAIRVVVMKYKGGQNKVEPVVATV